LGVTGADGPLSLELTVEQAVAVALANHPALHMAREEKEKARGDLMTAWSAMLPQAKLGLTYHRLDEVSKFTVEMPPGPPMEMKVGVRDNYKAEIELLQPLFLGGMGYNAVVLAGLSKDLASLQCDEAARNIVFFVKKTCIDILFAREAVAVLDAGLTNALAHHKNVEHRLAQKVGTRFDVLRAEVKVANARARLIKGRNDLSLGQSALVRTLGLPVDAQIRITDSLAYVAESVDEKASLARAWRDRLDFRMADLAVEIQGKQVDLAMGEIMPKVFGYFHYGWEKPSQKSFGGTDGADYWNAGIMVDLPLFDGFSTLGKIRRAYATLRQTRWAREDLRQQIALEVRMAVTSLKNAVEFLSSQKENVRQAEESLRLVSVGFSAGTNTQLDVLDVQTALTAARLNHLQAVYNCMAARFKLEQAEASFRQDTKIESGKERK
jgi:outer membrane protein TolC